MRIIDCEQGSEEWHLAKVGIPTASNFDKIITTKGKPSTQREKYMRQLAGERIIGKAEETYQNGAMQRGIEMEAEARKAYEFSKGEEVKQVGLCLSDGKAIYGASPDGFVNDAGLIEIKCPSLAVHVGYLLDNDLPSDYFQQTQGQLLVTERVYVNFVSYYPGIRPLILRVERDEVFIKALRVELELFCEELDNLVNKIK